MPYFAPSRGATGPRAAATRAGTRTACAPTSGACPKTVGCHRRHCCLDRHPRLRRGHRHSRRAGPSCHEGSGGGAGGGESGEFECGTANLVLGVECGPAATALIPEVTLRGTRHAA
eukprot:357031-Chlamydomonas_euryale.AAC.5